MRSDRESFKRRKSTYKKLQSYGDAVAPLLLLPGLVKGGSEKGRERGRGRKREGRRMRSWWEMGGETGGEKVDGSRETVFGLSAISFFYSNITLNQLVTF